MCKMNSINWTSLVRMRMEHGMDGRDELANMAHSCRLSRREAAWFGDT